MYSYCDFNLNQETKLSLGQPTVLPNSSTFGGHVTSSVT